MTLIFKELSIQQTDLSPIPNARKLKRDNMQDCREYVGNFIKLKREVGLIHGSWHVDPVACSQQIGSVGLWPLRLRY